VATDSWDVLIIGAGVAGLTAASKLAAQGHSVLILDAQDRVGGRAWTRHEPGLGAPIELGAEFIHGPVSETFELLSEVDQAPLETDGDYWTFRNGALVQRSDDLFAQIQSGLQQFADVRAKDAKEGDVSFDAFLASADQYGLTPDACKLARGSVQGFDAADPARVSTLSIAMEWSEGGMLDAPQFRPTGGYSSILQALTGALDRKNVRLQLQTIIKHVKWSRGESIEVDGEFLGQPFHTRASKVIVTVPLGVLQAEPNAPGAVRFTPSLLEKRVALQGLASGPVLKAVLQFRSAFWEALEEGRYRNAAFFFSPDASFPTFWTSLPLRAPLLNAWVGGAKAERLCGQSTTEMIGEALKCIETIFGARPGSLELEAAYVHNWMTDPCFRGAYSYVTVGGSDARQTLAAPVQDTLFFAGEATDTSGEGGTVAGALHSGTRAAHEVHESLSRRGS
jgi:monoamine oxidase